MTHSRTFSILGAVLATTFWFFDSCVHWLVYDEAEFEIVPRDFNELWMRLVIVCMLFGFGVFIDHHARRLREREQQLEKLAIYRSTVRASHYILNNFLHQMQIFKLEAEKSEDFDKRVLGLYDAVSDEASTLIKRLSELTEVSEHAIEDAVRPR